MGKVILCARDFPKRSPSELSRFKDLTLDKWIEESKKSI